MRGDPPRHRVSRGRSLGMILVLKPPGRGRWSPVLVTIQPSRNAPLPLYVARGQRVQLGGQVYRVAEVRA